MAADRRVALVTGAGRGIGLAICRRLAADGCALVMADIEREELRSAAKQVAEELDVPVLDVIADVTDTGQVNALVSAAVERFGQLDILVNNAGAIQIKPWLELSAEEWDRIFAVNVKGAFLVQQAVAPHMIRRGHGRIVNISSGAARGPAPNSAHYGAAKYALIHFTQSTAVDLGPHNITVNVVAPAVIAVTRLWDEIGAGYRQYFKKDKDERIAELVAQLPLRRPQTPEDVANAVAFLVSDDAREITGVLLDVDGGASL